MFAPLIVAVAAALAAFAPASSTAVDPAGLTAFQSPTGNIGCVVDATSSARCDIAEKSWTPPRKPRSCELDYGSGLTVGEKGRGQIACAGDTTLNSGRRVGYGDSVAAGRYACTVAEAGVTCRNRSTKHGFFISKASYRRF